jgi:curved DNA-binding protein CbpA
MTTGSIPESDVERILLWDRRLDDYDYFELLGVPESVSPKEVDAAYFRFARLFHPDNFAAPEPELYAALTRLFQRAVEARRVLSDPMLLDGYRQLVANGTKRFPEEQQRELLELTQVNLDEELPRLHATCRSAGAKLRAMAAATAWRHGRVDEAQRALADALMFDAQTNQGIERCLKAVGLRSGAGRR